MNTIATPLVTLTVPADVRYFRSVRLAIGGLATMVGFDIEAIDDLRIGVDEVCAALAEAGNGEDLRIEILAAPGERLRVEGTVPSGDDQPDEDRFAFSRQILSVVSDSFGYETEGGQVCCWLERRLSGDA
ncbi:ATP-binding protein [Aquihabitans daechungensis]|uniref:ATP-binding protein n=1 Tax=Aquihabitans daechungensis TaxID=1052257 RepID=UPI003B9FD41C